MKIETNRLERERRRDWAGRSSGASLRLRQISGPTGVSIREVVALDNREGAEESKGHSQTRSRAAGEQNAGAYPEAERVKQARAGQDRTEAGHHPRGCWAAPRPFEHNTARTQQFTDGSGKRLPPYLSLIDSFFNSEKLTKTEENFKEKAMAQVMKLNTQIKEAKIQQEQLQEDSRQLYNEKRLIQAEHKLIMEYLTNKTEEYRKQPVKLWNNYVQKSGEIELRRQESASRYARQTSVLNAELLLKEKTQTLLKHKLKAMKDILILKELQELEAQTLQEEKRRVQDETASKAQIVQGQLLQQKALLEKQLSEPDMSQLGKRKTWELKKSQALELAAKQYALEFYLGINRENQQLQLDLKHLIQQSQELVACQSQLKNRKQQLQREQWCLEGLIRGRHRIQGRYNWCLKEQDVLKTTLAPPLGTKSRINPK
ncbi:PREDICTED: coiled-coil domain-containing protein 121 [Chrysochloris asiatica]|uniref:Coiled-coil domain-containing protein 121 n=1 Tax=Chrysochloris asiatica TaxID=185453 RepID=A0A9B0TAS2_CHRAS|nr:PREDICTED: coiled-coil domain-containing protein 121 [Chrysochloris asiatica]